MSIRGEKQFVRGGVLFLLADTLAVHSIGGFKVGVGFSLRKCRMCLATKEQLSKKVYRHSGMMIRKLMLPLLYSFKQVTSL